jgi:hypothetical protein
MEEFIDHVQTEGSRARLEGYLGPIDPESSDGEQRDDSDDDDLELAYRCKKEASALIAWGEGTKSLTTRICTMFNLPPSDFDFNARNIVSDAVIVCLSDAAKRKDIPNPRGDCCTYMTKLNPGMFSSVSDRDSRSIKFIVGLFGLVPCPASELRNYNGSSPSDWLGPSDSDDDGQATVEPAWRIVFHT